MEALEGGAVSYERGTRVGAGDGNGGVHHAGHAHQGPGRKAQGLSLSVVLIAWSIYFRGTHFMVHLFSWY